ncbi:MAG TPA: hypothetical protein EYO99_00510 [Candidatus Marinimicrobia bacterium]|jgi:hypothetical protein|nr:hypothetical protein [Candidatus Neomarinimicrobiota bacterium]
MIRRIALHLVVLSHLFVVSCGSSAPPPTTAVKRAIETRQYDMDFDTLMKGSIGVLQDLGYTIDVLNDNYGLITATKQTTLGSGSAESKEMSKIGKAAVGIGVVLTLGLLLSRDKDNDSNSDGDCLFCGWGGGSSNDGPNVYNLKTTINIAQESEDPVSSTIRINFQASREQGGTVKYAGSTHSMKFFQSFFTALDKSLFLDVNLESGEATIVEEN